MITLLVKIIIFTAFTHEANADSAVLYNHYVRGTHYHCFEVQNRSGNSYDLRCNGLTLATGRAGEAQAFSGPLQVSNDEYVHSTNEAVPLSRVQSVNLMASVREIPGLRYEYESQGNLSMRRYSDENGSPELTGTFSVSARLEVRPSITATWLAVSESGRQLIVSSTEATSLGVSALTGVSNVQLFAIPQQQTAVFTVGDAVQATTTAAGPNWVQTADHVTLTALNAAGCASIGRFAFDAELSSRSAEALFCAPFVGFSEMPLRNITDPRERTQQALSLLLAMQKIGIPLVQVFQTYFVPLLQSQAALVVSQMQTVRLGTLRKYNECRIWRLLSAASQMLELSPAFMNEDICHEE